MRKYRAAAGGGGSDLGDRADFKAGHLARMTEGGGDEKSAPTGQRGADNDAQVESLNFLKYLEIS